MPAKPNELQLTRLYNAPVKLVWDAWTDPAKVAKWWGPRGFTLTTHSKDLRAGGHWRYTMHGPDGTDYENHTLYYEVEKYSKLVYDHGGYEDRPPLFRVTVTFEEFKGKTKMVMTMAFESPERAKEMSKFIKQAGGNSTWDRLGEFLDDDRSFIINRTFETDATTLFNLWTDPSALSRWLPPTGLTMEVLRGETKTNGRIFFKMSDGKDLNVYGTFQYLEVGPGRIVYIHGFTDRDGNVSPHPLATVWPESMLVTVTFAEEETRKTRVTVNMLPYGEVKPEEALAFHKEKPGMTLGWTGSFDKLEEIST
jgi:uncharacterized protein YndB with AHSA1/START domain